MSNTKTGYKQTPLGVIPANWEMNTIGNVIKFSGGSQPALKYFKFQETEGYVRLIQTRDYRTDKYKTYIPKDSVKKFCTENDIMIGRYGPPIFQIFKGLRGAYNVALIKATPLDFVNKDYCYYFLCRPELRMFLEGLSQRSGGQTGVEIDKLNGFPFPLPPLPEQQKIASILSTWDVAIEFCKSTLDALLKRRKWLARELLSNKKANSKYEIIKHVSLSKLVNRVKNQFSPEPDKLYKQIGIRSHCKGIFYKEEVTGESLGNKSVFYIEPDCFIVNIVFAWEHAIAKTTVNEVGMIASHRFPMFKPKEGVLDLNYMLHFFKSKKGKDLLELASPGGAGRNKTLGQSEFLKLQIPLPSFEKQKVIAEVLDKADYEITLYQQKLQQLQLQKKGLMQQLLTGKTRVKID